MNERLARLRELENSIRGRFEAFVETGRALLEIKETNLFLEDRKADGSARYPNWMAYMRQRVLLEFEIEERQAQRLMTCAAIRPKLPDLPPKSSPSGPTVTDPAAGWSIEATVEFGRLAEKNKNPKDGRDYSTISKAAAQRVAKAAIAAAGGKRPTRAQVRQAVADEKGWTKPKPKRKPADDGIKLPHYLQQCIDRIEVMLEHLELVSGAGWERLAETDPVLAERLAKVCDELAKFMRQ